MLALEQPGPDAFSAGDALAFVHAVAQHVVAQRQGLLQGVPRGSQEIGVGVRQRAARIEIEQQQRPIHRRQYQA
ncbi:hypothetical protein G6F59_018879 [Rhizopus arrhizus]|nr:hypothetical protein G6F59_018879 [Rhizopus arrhizus]